LGTALPETSREIRSAVVRAGREMAAERGLAFVFRLPVASNARNGLRTAGRLMVDKIAAAQNRLRLAQLRPGEPQISPAGQKTRLMAKAGAV
jgi:hypothetical protein